VQFFLEHPVFVEKSTQCFTMHQYWYWYRQDPIILGIGQLVWYRSNPICASNLLATHGATQIHCHRLRSAVSMMTDELPWVQCPVSCSHHAPVEPMMTTVQLGQSGQDPSQNQLLSDLYQTGRQDVSDIETCSTTRQHWWSTPAVHIHTSFNRR